jgi:hypothetical protein
MPKGMKVTPGYLKNRKCHYCGIRNGNMTRDHIVPRSLGGFNATWNYAAACAPCNEKKADDWPTCQCDNCKQAVWRHRRLGIVKPKKKELA